MRKLFSTAVMAAMVFGSTSMASAATTDFYNDLQRIVYDPTQIEIISSIPSAPDPGAGSLVPGAFGLSKFQADTTWADLDVAYWGLNKVFDHKSGLVNYYTYDFYFSSSNSGFSTATPVLDFVNTNAFSSYNTAFSSVTQLLSITEPTTELLASNPNSYTTRFNIVDGALAGLVRDQSAEKNLGIFDQDGLQYVDQYIYQVHVSAAGEWSFITGDATDYLYKIRTNEDGSSIVVQDAPPAAVPVPGAVWLLGSGLMGLVGLRRRNVRK